MKKLKQKIAPASERRCRATTAVEFALIAPVLMTFIIGIMELAIIMMVHNIMENTAYNAARLAKTGYVAEGSTQLATVEQAYINELGGLAPLVDVSKITMTTTSFGSLSNYNNNEQSAEGFGSAQDVLVFRISYPWHVFTLLACDLFGLHSADINKDCVLTLTSSIVVRNEPY